MADQAPYTVNLSDDNIAKTINEDAPEERQTQEANQAAHPSQKFLTFTLDDIKPEDWR